MYIIVVGGGKVGYYLTKTLLTEGYEVLLIERNADAIVMAATNRVRFGKTTIGETALYILRNAPCEVIVVRQALGE